MIGKYIVYESIFRDRIVVRIIAGQTPAYWKVQNPRSLEFGRVKKSSLGQCAIFDNLQDAQKAANRYTDKLIKARKHFLDRRGQIFAELENEG